MQDLLGDLLAAGIDRARALCIGEGADHLLAAAGNSQEAAERCWKELTRSVLTPETPFPVHQLLYERTYRKRDPAHGPAPAWIPTDEEIRASNLHALMRERGCATYAELFDWSVTERTAFWRHLAQRLRIRFAHPCHAVADLSDLRQPRWFPGGPAEHRGELLQRAGRRGGGRTPSRGRPAAEPQLRRVAGTGQPRRQRAVRRRLPSRRRHRAGPADDRGVGGDLSRDHLRRLHRRGHRRQLRRRGDRRPPADHGSQGDLHPGPDPAPRQAAAPVRQGGGSGRTAGNRAGTGHRPGAGEPRRRPELGGVSQRRRRLRSTSVRS